MDEPGFRLLVITDVHHVPGAAEPNAALPDRRVDLAAELLRRAIEDALHRGGFDAIALAGDLLDDGTRPDAQAGLEQLRDAIRAAAPDAPLLVVPGNHDGDTERLFRVFDCGPGPREIGPYRFVVFADRYAAGDFCTRSDADRRLLAELAATPGGPIVVLQHNPMNPEIDCAEYPYMLTNRAQVMAEYGQAGVLLSISGHAHWGQELNFQNGVGYFTCPALCVAPYRYAILTLRDREVSAKVHGLRFEPSPAVVDVHVHTEFAYCGRDIAADKMIARARELGLAGLVLTEHVPQLYVQADDFWNGRHVRAAGLWRIPTFWRIEQFRAAMDRVRSMGILPMSECSTGSLPVRVPPMSSPFPSVSSVQQQQDMGKMPMLQQQDMGKMPMPQPAYVRIGLEVELDAQGELILRDEDRDWADVLVGAVHFLSQDVKTLSDAQIAAEFMRTTEGLLLAGVHVLAHPLRIFSWAKRPTPPELFRPLAQMLASSGAAAEINFHLNTPEEEFFAECISAGVKIAFGSDSHELREVGNLGANLDIVQRLAGRLDVEDLLYYPQEKRQHE